MLYNLRTSTKNQRMNIKDIIIKDLKKSRMTAHRWTTDGDYPAEACLKIEQITKGKITAQSLRPDLFKPTPAQNEAFISLVHTLRSFDELNNQSTALLSILLRLLKTQQPIVYDKMMEILKTTPAGISYLKQRSLYTNEKI